MDKNVLFVVPPRIFQYGDDGISTKHPARPSIPAMAILGSLEEAGYNTSFVDCVADGYNIEKEIANGIYQYGLLPKDVIEIIDDKKPSAVLSTSMFSSEQDCVDRLFMEVKSEFFEIPVVLGGIHATQRSSWHLESVPYDAIVLGEGERVIVKVLDSILDGQDDLKNIQGVAFRDTSGKIINTGLANPVDSIGGRWALKTVLFKEDGSYRYLENVDMATLDRLYRPERTERNFVLYTGRGCPYKCHYCGVSQKDGAHLRHRGVDNVFSEFKSMVEEYGVSRFHNQTDAFLLHPEDRELLTRLAEYRKEGKEFTIDNPDAFYVNIFFPKSNGHSLDFELVDLLYDAGFISLTIAIETFNQRFNHKIDFSRISTDKIAGLLKYARSTGLKTDAYMMYGFPEQTEKEIKYDLSQIEIIKPYLDALNYRSLLLFPGSQYYEQIVGAGKISEELYREAVRKGYSFRHFTEEFNLTQLDSEKLRELVRGISFN